MTDIRNFGLITRADDQFLYVWLPSDHLVEVRVPRTNHPELTCADVVQYSFSKPLNEVQDNATLLKFTEHGLTILHPPNNEANFRVQTNLLIPPEGTKYFEKQEKHYVKNGTGLRFMAFSIVFGTVASFNDLEVEPGKVYRGSVGRMPENFDRFKDDIDTIFLVLNKGLKENTDAGEIELINSFAPWNKESDSDQAKDVADNLAQQIPSFQADQTLRSNGSYASIIPSSSESDFEDIGNKEPLSDKGLDAENCVEEDFQQVNDVLPIANVTMGQAHDSIASIEIGEEAEKEAVALANSVSNMYRRLVGMGLLRDAAMFKKDQFDSVISYDLIIIGHCV